MLILTEPLNYGGRLYIAGEDVRGKLPLDLIQQLQDGGYIEEQEAERDLATAGGEPDSGVGNGERKPALDDPLKDTKSTRGK